MLTSTLGQTTLVLLLMSDAIHAIHCMMIYAHAGCSCSDLFPAHLPWKAAQLGRAVTAAASGGVQGQFCTQEEVFILQEANIDSIR